MKNIKICMLIVACFLFTTTLASARMYGFTYQFYVTSVPTTFKLTSTRGVVQATNAGKVVNFPCTASISGSTLVCKQNEKGGYYGMNGCLRGSCSNPTVLVVGNLTCEYNKNVCGDNSCSNEVIGSQVQKPSVVFSSCVVK